MYCKVGSTLLQTTWWNFCSPLLGYTSSRARRINWPVPCCTKEIIQRLQLPNGYCWSISRWIDTYSFISGLSSPYIRQRLVEHKTLTQDKAYRQAVALESTQKNSNAYNPTLHIAAIHTATLDNDAPEETIYDSVTSKINTKDSTLAATNNNTTSRKKCSFCGGTLNSCQSYPVPLRKLNVIIAV